MFRHALMVALLVLMPLAAFAADFAVGDQVVLRPTNPLGVSLHREARSSMFDRGGDGTRGQVTDTAQDGRWLPVDLQDGRTAWVVSKNLEAATGSPSQPTPQPGATFADDEGQVFASLQGCEAIVSAGRRMAPMSADTLRIGAWNIRWFPDGDLTPSADSRTDLPWLACVLAWLNVDVLALQEIRTHRGAEDAWASVTDGLVGFNGGDWRVDLHECAGEDQQHVGFLWNAARVSLSNARDRWRMNGAADLGDSACASNLRPGRSAYVAAISGGADLHLVSVHFDSGRARRDFDHRRTVFERFGDMHGALRAELADDDVVILGDFNTMGHSEAGGMDSPQEIAAMRAQLAQGTPGFTALQATIPCSEYFQGRCSQLDHVAVSSALISSEAQGAGITVTGYCAVAGGADLDRDNMPAAYKGLSDHCPLITSIRNQDMD